MKINDIEKIHKHFRKTGQYLEAQIEKADITKSETNPSEYFVSIPVPTRKFINDILIDELYTVTKASNWWGFVSIGCGIEFLGKCIDKKHPVDWDVEKRSSFNFNDAIANLNGLKKYEYLLNKNGFKLYDEFRCGLIHGLAPKGKVSLSSGDKGEKNLTEKLGKITFNIDELYADFKLACIDVINRDFTEPNKMNWSKVNFNFTIEITNIK